MTDGDTYTGSFTITPKLDSNTLHLLNGLISTRRMKRDPVKLAQLLGITPVQAIDRYGLDGEFYFNPAGQSNDNSIVDYNQPPANQPSLWINWKIETDPDSEISTISWDGSEKFREPEGWIKYLIDRILQPRGYTVNGRVKWFGLGHHLDAGYIKVTNNVTTAGMLYI